MKFSAVALLLLSTASNAFVIQPQQKSIAPTTSRVVLQAETDGSNIPKRSFFEGNQRDPTEEELTLMDQMIDKLSDAKPYELPNAVRRAFRVISSPQFFMRIAIRTDQASSDEEKEKLGALSSNLVATLQAVVDTTEDTLDERAKEVEAVLKAAAEPETGEFLVPLLPTQVEGMRKVMDDLDPTSLDEGFLSTVDAWMNKSHQDGMDGMVGILQKILQMYSGIQILRARKMSEAAVENIAESDTTTPASELFEKLLKVDTDLWDVEIRNGTKEMGAKALVTEIQRTMESVVLGLENGSMSQRVQAEYLQELVKKAEAAQK